MPKVDDVTNILRPRPLQPTACPHCLGTGRLIQVTTIKLGGADMTVIADPLEPDWRIGPSKR